MSESEFDFRLSLLLRSVDRCNAVTRCGGIISDELCEEFDDSLAMLWKAAENGSRPTSAINLGTYADKPIGRLSSFTKGARDESGHAIQTVGIDDFSSWELIKYNKRGNRCGRILVWPLS